MGGPVKSGLGNMLSDVSKKTKIGGANGISPLDPLQLGPSMFDSPGIPKPTPPPAPVDGSDAYFRELARMNTDRRLRAGKGTAASFVSPSVPGASTKPGGGL